MTSIVRLTAVDHRGRPRTVTARIEVEGGSLRMDKTLRAGEYWTPASEQDAATLARHFLEAAKLWAMPEPGEKRVGQTAHASIFGNKPEEGDDDER